MVASFFAVIRAVGLRCANPTYELEITVQSVQAVQIVQAANGTERHFPKTV